MTTRQAILNLIHSHRYRPLRTRRLARFFDVAEEDYGEFRTLVKRLIRDGELAIGPRGQIVPPGKPTPKREKPPGNTVVGRFSQAAGGFGFVIPDEPGGPSGDEDVFIPADKRLNAVTGDTVLAKVDRKDKRGYAGHLLEVLQRGTTQFVGTFYETQAGPVVRPDGGILHEDFDVPDARSAGAKPKDKVVFEVLSYGLRGDPGQAVITEVLGHRGDPGVDTLAVIRQFELPDDFADEVMDEARRATARLNDAALDGRRDLTGELIITIDPEDARDFDDAISLTRAGDGIWTLGIHIADVAFFVEEGSALDTEARERGTSVYLPTTVLPMLPQTLSNGVCSLQEGRTRLTKSVLMRLAADGELLDVELANTVIRSAKRLTYREATAALEGETGGLAPEVVDLLTRMDRLARALHDRRKALGYMELELPEVELEFDDDGRVVGAHPEDTSYSHKIIEMFMVAANEAVAARMEALGAPILRRVHPEPDAEAAEDLKHFATSSGYKLKDPTDRFELQRLVDAVRGKPEAYGIHLAVLRSLKRAEYSPALEGHFALGSEAYCHFTSPIRRYPDLLVHRKVDAAVKGKLKAKKGGRRKKRGGGKAPAPGEGLVEVARHCNVTERRAEGAERELTKVKLLEYLQGKLGETFSGVITGVQAFGLFVEIPELLIDGLVHVSRLTDDHYRFDKRKWALVGSRKGRTLRVGTPLQVRIAAVDIARRKLDLEPVEDERRRKKTATKDAKAAPKKGMKKPSPKGAAPTGKPQGAGKARRKAAKRKRR